MARKQKLIPTSIFLYLSRTAQVVVSIIVLGLDISVINEWDQNKFSFNAAAGSASSNIKTWVGGTPFTGIIMFTVSHLFHGTGLDLILPVKMSR
jgi:hypothetical protein